MRTAALRWGRTPTPAGDVFEEHPQVNHVVVELDQRDGAAVAIAPTPGAVAVPGQERLDVGGALQLVQAVHPGMALGQVVDEYHHRFGAGIDAAWS